MSLAESYSSRWRNSPSNRNICLKSQKKSKRKQRHSPLVCGWTWVCKANGRKSPNLSCFHDSASLEARLEREHQWAATTVLAQESRSVSLHAIGPGPNSPAPESTGRERPWVLKLLRVDFEPVLCRPLETTRLFGSWAT